MSFLYQNGPASKADSLVLLAQKRHYHQVQKYNKQTFASKMEAKRSLKTEIDGKYSRINEEVTDSLNIEGRARRKQKSLVQSILKNAYEQQIRLKEERRKLQRQHERQYAKMYNELIEYSNQRRIAQQLGRYRTPSLHAVRERVKSEASFIENSDKMRPHMRSFESSQKDRIFLPSLSRPNQVQAPVQRSSQSLRKFQLK